MAGETVTLTTLVAPPVGAGWELEPLEAASRAGDAAVGASEQAESSAAAVTAAARANRSVERRIGILGEVDGVVNARRKSKPAAVAARGRKPVRDMCLRDVGFVSPRPGSHRGVTTSSRRDAAPSAI